MGKKLSLFVVVLMLGIFTQNCFCLEEIILSNELPGRFGTAISVDELNVVVGNSHNRNFSGTACNYNFRNLPEILQEILPGELEDLHSRDWYGRSISSSRSIIAVGSPGYYGFNLEQPGAVFVYHRAGIRPEDEFILRATLRPDDPEVNDRFGFSVSVASSGNLILVGARGEDNFAGCAYVFRREGHQWTQESRLCAFGAEGQNDVHQSDSFGYSVAIQDNYGVVSAPFYDLELEDGTVMVDGGAVFVFKFTNEEWTPLAKLIARNPSGIDGFGECVDISSDHIVVGAPRTAGDGGPTTGAVYIFKNIPLWGVDDWVQVAQLTASDAERAAHFGSAVSINNYYCAVGSYGIGATYVFGLALENGEWNEETWEELEKLTPSNSNGDCRFGDAVSISDNICAVGAPLNPPSGSAYLYLLDMPKIIIGEISQIDSTEIFSEGLATFSIANLGIRDLKIYNIEVDGQYFALSDEDFKVLIEPDSLSEINVVFCPEEAGEHEGVLKITSNDPCNPVIEYRLTGRAVTLNIQEPTISENFSIFTYPNPFNSSATIRFSLPVSGQVDLSIYDLYGREIKEIISKNFSAGNYNLKFEADEFPNGVYILQLTVDNNFTTTTLYEKLLLVK